MIADVSPTLLPSWLAAGTEKRFQAFAAKSLCRNKLRRHFGSLA